MKKNICNIKMWQAFLSFALLLGGLNEVMGHTRSKAMDAQTVQIINHKLEEMKLLPSKVSKPAHHERKNAVLNVSKSELKYISAWNQNWKNNFETSIDIWGDDLLDKKPLLFDALVNAFVDIVGKRQEIFLPGLAKALRPITNDIDEDYIKKVENNEIFLKNGEEICYGDVLANGMFTVSTRCLEHMQDFVLDKLNLDDEDKEDRVRFIINDLSINHNAYDLLLISPEKRIRAIDERIAKSRL